MPPLEDNATLAINSALKTLTAESAGLRALQTALATPYLLGEAFSKAVALIEHGRGRVVVTGMGKSGHIGRKIQATFASTGTPALFVHPSEAAHGDLGMIDGTDVLLVISQSGETSELTTILEYAARHALPIIGITASEKSTLAKASSLVLRLPRAKEACPMGLAPTTSTLMQLALGDALAIALLERRKFTATDFRAFHPGGQLGNLLKPVHKFMHRAEALPLGRPETPLSSVILEMTRKAFGCIGIVDSHGVFVGLISDGDLRPALMRDLHTTCAAEIMNRTPVTTHPDCLAQEIIHLMTSPQKAINSIFVLDKESHPVGIVHLHDLVRIGIA